MATLEGPPRPPRLQLTPAQLKEIATALTRRLLGDQPLAVRRTQEQLVHMRWEARMARERAAYNPQVKATASSMLSELRVEAALPRPPPDHAVNKKMLADARLLMLLSRPEKRDQEPKALTRSTRCGRCDECRKGDCGMCYNCRDKPRFGGQGVRKQACKMRKCLSAGKVVQTCSKN